MIVSCDEGQHKKVTRGPRRQGVACVSSTDDQPSMNRRAEALFDPFAPMQELTRLVSREVGVSVEQAARAAECALRFLTLRLPSPVIGQIRTLLEARPDDETTNA
jgi:hypothetical protein